MEELVLRLARDRGIAGNTFATADELSVDGYAREWLRGRIEGCLDDAEAALRSPEGDRQHNVNLALYSIRDARRLFESGFVAA